MYGSGEYMGEACVWEGYVGEGNVGEKWVYGGGVCVG